MRFKSCHLLNLHRMWAIMPCSTNMGSGPVIFVVVVPIGWGVFNKIIIPLAFVGYEKIINLTHG